MLTQSALTQELEKSQLGLGALATTPDGTHHADHRHQWCSAALLQTRPWERKKYCEEPLVLWGKQINLRAHEQVSGLTYLLLSCKDRRKTLWSSLPLFHVHTLLQPQEMLRPCSFLENLPYFSCCHGSTRGHQDKASCTWGRSTKVLSLQLLGLDHTKLIIWFDILWRAWPLWAIEIKRH